LKAPLNKFDSPMEIIQFFGDKRQYLQALTELECETYKVA